jgi:D-glycero-D-manno-heptose 1,7-bisphosphate phosphatase
MSQRAFFLDRDGTINVDKNYLYKVEDWEWTPRAIDAIKLINSAGYLAIVVTNQAGIARGYYTDKDVETLHQQVDQMLAKYDAKIDAYYYCPHHTEFGSQRECHCRKPNPGMLLQARKDFKIDFDRSYLIGDKLIDAQAAINVGVKPALVRTGYGQAFGDEAVSTLAFYDNLYEAVVELLIDNNE